MSASTLGSDHVCESSPTAMAPARVLTFAEVKGELLSVVPWRVLEDGTELDAPRFDDKPLLLDFTEGRDAWLRAKAGIDYVGLLKKHHFSSETVACKVLLELSEEIAENVSMLDKEIMHRAMRADDMASAKSGFNWMPMMRTETTVMANIVLEVAMRRPDCASSVMTALCNMGLAWSSSRHSWATTSSKISPARYGPRCSSSMCKAR